MSVAANPAPTCDHDHVVGIYQHDEELVSAVVPFLADALGPDGGVAVVVATAAHRRALDAALAELGFPLGSLTASGRYRRLDARATLDAFIRDGRPDPAAFASTVGAVLDETAATDGPVRVFGEMVGLLWDEGNVTAAVELETLWNELAECHDFALFCGYSMSALEGSADLAAVAQMCERHSSIVPLGPRDSTDSQELVASGRDGYERMFVAAPSAVRDVRRFVRGVLRVWNEDELDGAAEVVASELATNAVRHARSPFRISISRAPATIRIAVRDTSFAPPQQLSRDASPVGGRGVRLVAALSRSWGVLEETDGKTVWAEVTRAQVP